MKRLLKGLVLGLAVNTFCIGCLCAKVCFLPIGGCEEEWYKMPVDENSISCSPGYSSTVTSCSGNFTLVTEEVIGGTCGKCECNLSCSGHEDLNLTTCTCENTLCPLGTSMSCVDDACYDCEYKETLPDGTRCYKNTRKQATCPPDYTTSKPSARCLLSQKQTCGDNTCYKEKICSNEDEELDENCNCVPANKNECPYGYSDKQNHKCDDVIEKGELKCYKSKTCDVGYKLDEETCECKPYCEEPYSLEATNKCDDYIMFGDHKCYKEKKCTQQYYSLNPDTCECECDEELIEDNGEEKCVDCDDGGHNPCTEKGYKLCREEDFLIGEGSVVCTCGDEEYYERCSTLEQCYVDQDAVLGTIDGCHQELSINSTSKYHDAANNAYVSIGRYFVKNKCQKVDLSWIIHTAECNTQKDCNGNAGPAYGKIDTAECVGNVGEGTVSCGGADYATSCKCPYKKNANISANGGSCSYFDESSLPLAGYYKVEGYDCTAGGETYVGVASCLASVDCKGNPGPAYGKMKESQCVGGKGVNPIECGGETYVDSCQCTYKKGDVINANGGICFYYEENTSLLNSGYYRADGYNCTAGTETGAAVASCTVKKDCNGNQGPAYGLRNCKGSGLYPADPTPVVCGGIVYSAQCKDACNYDDTEATCKAQGKSFISYCVAHTDTGDVPHGACVD